MKMIHGSCSLAYANISRINRADSPIYLSTMAEDTTLRKFVERVAATARASNVLPVPGGPYKSTPAKQLSGNQPIRTRDSMFVICVPLGGLIPTRMNSSGFIRGSSMTCHSPSMSDSPLTLARHHQPLVIPEFDRPILRYRRKMRLLDPPSTYCRLADQPRAVEY